MTTPAMPELPEPDRTMWQHGKQINHYTADQMRAYALAALSSQPSPEQAGVSDEEILTEAARHLGEMHVENCGLGDITAFARAILALRPAQQAVPMTLPDFDELSDEAIDNACAAGGLYRADLMRAWESLRVDGITAQGAQEGV